MKMNVKNNGFADPAVLIISSMAINAQPQRVISLAPHITEMVYFASVRAIGWLAEPNTAAIRLLRRKFLPSARISIQIMKRWWR
ncbi:MAG: hypothetical protein R3C26_07280 [Calditrichia bacterium]